MASGALCGHNVPSFPAATTIDEGGDELAQGFVGGALCGPPELCRRAAIFFLWAGLVPVAAHSAPPTKKKIKSLFAWSLISSLATN